MTDRSRRMGSLLSGRGACSRCLPNDGCDDGEKEQDESCRKGSSVSQSWKEHLVDVNTL